MFKSKKILLPGLASTIAMLAGTGLHAQESNSELQEVVVVSSRTEVPLRQIGTSVSVLDEEQIEAYGNFALTDILRQTPSVGSSRNGVPGSTTALRIRGEEGYRTLILLDGMKLSDPSSTQVGPHLEHLLSSEISRVEILRGPQGLAYGADAGGVVNISSKAIEEGFAGTANAQAGSFGTRQVSANLGGGNDVVDFSLAATDFSSDGFNTRRSDTVLQDDDGYDNQSLHLRAGWQASDALRIQVVHRQTDGESEFDGCSFSPTLYDCSASYELDATRLSATLTTAALEHSLAYSVAETDRVSYAAGVSNFTSLGQLDRWEYKATASQLPGFDLVFGVDLEQEQSNAIERDNEGYYVEVMSDFSEALFLTAGIRRDENDDYGKHTSFRVSGAYLLSLSDANTLKFRASLGSGFRAPSPFEVDYNAGPFAYPPASTTLLSEENSEGYELGIEFFGGDRLTLEVVYFDQDVENAIEFDLATFSGYVQSQGVSNSQGVELGATVHLTDNWQVSGNYTYNDTEQPDGLQRLRRPKHLANLGLNFVSDDSKWLASGFYRSARDTVDSNGFARSALEDYGVFDLSLRYRYSENIEIFARLENAFDEQYQEVLDYNSADRSSYIGVKLGF